MANDQATFDERLSRLVEIDTKLAADVVALKTAVEAFIANAPAGVDTSGLEDAIASITASDATVEATDAEVEPTPAPVDEPAPTE